ncbi:MAG: alpha/beta hydrolase [Candidatus Brocadiae bacterium]|nr:alpha/beta hydrolase [Candidatus Brocadiia bacterium]
MHRAALLFAAVLALPLAAQEPARGREADGVTVERDVEYGVARDISLRLDLYRPAELPGEPMPAVVWIHGGGWRGGDKNNAANCIALARRGFLAVSINYRLSGVAPFPAAVEDSKCAVRWLRSSAAKLRIDPERIGVWGSSAGGHLALMVGCADEGAGLEGKGGYAGVSSRVRAVISWFGPSDLRGSVLPDGPVSQFLGGSPADRKDEAAAASPIVHASADDPPVLFCHGDRDGTVPLGESERMSEALTRAGVKNELIVVKGGGHGWGRGGETEPSAEEVLERCLAFLERELSSGVEEQRK